MPARLAVRHAGLPVMSGAYFVCGMQLVFLTTHLPSYLAICGMDPMLSAQALGMIGAFNVAGQPVLRLGRRALVTSWCCSGCHLHDPLAGAGLVLHRAADARSTLVFAAMMGFLWLGVAPLVAGMVAEMFGLRWQAMIQGLAFISHQLGSFVGAFGGGLLYDALGSYTWRGGSACAWGSSPARCSCWVPCPAGRARGAPRRGDPAPHDAGIARATVQARGFTSRLPDLRPGADGAPWPAQRWPPRLRGAATAGRTLCALPSTVARTPDGVAADTADAGADRGTPAGIAGERADRSPAQRADAGAGGG